MSAPQIITHHWPKPIPDPSFDWSAIGNEHMCGWGRTEQEAIEDLERLQQEHREWLLDQEESR
jgi:hypothetical protein